MKVYLSADIEGVAGIAAWEEARKGTDTYEYFRTQMSKEVAAACRGALSAGASEVVVKDAHASGMNIIPSILPEGVRIIRSWTGGPQSMMDGLDASFGAVMFVGYHSAGGEDGNPLAHTKNSSKVERLFINGVLSSEYAANSFTAGMHCVPVVFLSGDKMLCENAVRLSPGITTVTTLEGIGNASLSLHPETSVKLIEKNAEEAIREVISKPAAKESCMIEMPETFELSLRFKSHPDAYKAAYFPGAFRIDEMTVGYRCVNYIDALKFMYFCI